MKKILIVVVTILFSVSMILTGSNAAEKKGRKHQKPSPCVKKCHSDERACMKKAKKDKAAKKACQTTMKECKASCDKPVEKKEEKKEEGQ